MSFAEMEDRKTKAQFSQRPESDRKHEKESPVKKSTPKEEEKE